MKTVVGSWCVITLFPIRIILYFHWNHVSIAQCKTIASPLLTHWRYCRLVLSHRYVEMCMYMTGIRDYSIHEYDGAPDIAKRLPWWRHQVETFSVLLALCAGNSPVTGEFPTQRPVTRSFDVFFDLGLNKPLSKQSCGWWFETPLCPL